MMGEVSEQALYDGFYIQAESLKKGSVDAICVEAMSAVDEAILAIHAAKDATGLEVVCTFTFEKTLSNEYKTLMGVSPVETIKAVIDAGASVIGANCGDGFDQMIDIVSQIRNVDPLTSILVHANAGRPVIENGQTVFPETPEMMACKVERLIKCGANIIGCCCGTTGSY
ncbi:MAG: homocysteine S-methyltransferase family protein [Ignavibacteriaceae bacterium]